MPGSVSAATATFFLLWSGTAAVMVAGQLRVDAKTAVPAAGFVDRRRRNLEVGSVDRREAGGEGRLKTG